MITILMFFLWITLTGCSALNTVTGAATGIVDCTVWKVASNGVTGLLWIPVAPLEGAYRGAQMGWYSDRMLLTGRRDEATFLSHMLPCTAHTATRMFGGDGLSWDMQ
jgi:hypothetical protein